MFWFCYSVKLGEEIINKYKQHNFTMRTFFKLRAVVNWGFFTYKDNRLRWRRGLRTHAITDTEWHGRKVTDTQGAEITGKQNSLTSQAPLLYPSPWFQRPINAYSSPVHHYIDQNTLAFGSQVQTIIDGTARRALLWIPPTAASVKGWSHKTWTRYKRSHLVALPPKDDGK